MDLPFCRMLSVAEALYFESVDPAARVGLRDLLSSERPLPDLRLGEHPAAQPIVAPEPVEFGPDDPPPWWDSDDVVAAQQQARLRLISGDG